jgi:hypothetical protein
MNRKVRLKILTYSRQTITGANHSFGARCASCHRRVEMITALEAAGILRTDDLAIGRLIDAGRIHTMETVSGGVWICKDSLFLTVGGGS